MLMTPKYRSLKAFYLTFHLLDDTIFLSIILSLFIGKDLDFEEVLEKHWKLFIVIACEAIYGVFEYHVHVWILNRVSVYFVLILYASYCIVLTLTNGWDKTIEVLLSLRFFSFLCELGVDLLIDLELHHDLKDGNIHPMPVDCISAWCCGNLRNELQEEHDLTQMYKLPTGWRYKGSIVAWTSLNTFKLNDELLKTEKLVKLRQCAFHCMVIFTIIITSPITIIIWLSMFILSLIRLCCCRCCGDFKSNRTICAECTKNRSW